MKKIITSLCILALLNFYNPALATVKVPSGTIVLLKLDQTVTSKNPIESQSATIIEDVIINGVKIFKAGDKATISVTDYQKAGCWGNGGKLYLGNGYAYDTKGNRQKILYSAKMEGQEKVWVKGACAAGIILWPLLLFGFVHGNQAVVTTSKELETTIASQFEF